MPLSGAHKCANGKASEVAALLTRSGSRYVEAVKSMQAVMGLHSPFCC
jgi:hypothetical protein